MKGQRIEYEQFLGGITRAVSKARRARRKLCVEYGITTGRQWVRLRRQLRKAQKEQGASLPTTEPTT